MKRLLFLALTTLLLCVSCNDDIAPTNELPVVNYYNMAGNWQLTEYNGNSLAEGTYMILTLDRREHTFEMYDNLQSMYGQKRTGKYILTSDEDYETVTMSGFYDNGVGEWNHEYIVTLLSTDKLRLVSKDKPKETSIYKRISTLPAGLQSTTTDNP